MQCVRECVCIFFFFFLNAYVYVYYVYVFVYVVHLNYGTQVVDPLRLLVDRRLC